MPVFEYNAKNASTGQILKGSYDAPNRDELMGHLRKNRLVLVSLREASREFKIQLPGSGIKTRDVVIFTRQFATMINSGLPLVQSLNILAAQTENPKLKAVTKAVVFDVEAGNTLADSFAKHPSAFSQLYVNMVAAGEAGGILDTILLRLATFLEKNDALMRKVKSAMIYPAVISTVAGGAIAVLLIFVIPVFEESSFRCIGGDATDGSDGSRFRRPLVGRGHGRRRSGVASSASRPHRAGATVDSALLSSRWSVRAAESAVSALPDARHLDLVRRVDPRWPEITAKTRVTPSSRTQSASRLNCRCDTLRPRWRSSVFPPMVLRDRGRRTDRWSRRISQKS